MSIDRLIVEFRPADAADRREWDRALLIDDELKQAEIYPTDLWGIAEATVYKALMGGCPWLFAPCFRDPQPIGRKVEFRWPGQAPFVKEVVYQAILKVDASS